MKTTELMEIEPAEIESAKEFSEEIKNAPMFNYWYLAFFALLTGLYIWVMTKTETSGDRWLVTCCALLVLCVFTCIIISSNTVSGNANNVCFDMSEFTRLTGLAGKSGFGRMTDNTVCMTQEEYDELNALIEANGKKISDVKVSEITLGTQATPSSIYGRFIRFHKNSESLEDKILNIAQIEIYDDADNLITQNLVPTSSSVWNSSTNPVANIVDKNYCTWSATALNDPSPYFEIDIGRARPISRVVVINRQDSLTRALGASLTVYDANRVPLYTSPPITTSSNSYSFRPISSEMVAAIKQISTGVVGSDMSIGPVH